jgi:hypothetical protein
MYGEELKFFQKEVTSDFLEHFAYEESVGQIWLRLAGLRVKLQNNPRGFCSFLAPESF